MQASANIDIDSSKILFRHPDFSHCRRAWILSRLFAFPHSSRHPRARAQNVLLGRRANFYSPNIFPFSLPLAGKFGSLTDILLLDVVENSSYWGGKGDLPPSASGTTPERHHLFTPRHCSFNFPACAVYLAVSHDTTAAAFLTSLFCTVFSACG